ncbi:hypothetical protein [Candidatus Uabimicrobium amorphum]|uniref:Uncharacterized protein n=1 Tax=Uabimicrobium amorphum TaxID=2596890 RepID=A0A5S9F258_UABAM|nr:hypothetical protein [Candidatus Uabimicrobium amorphum]BBM83317.1 hypothetical protein UABAM_01668 [Candidatus Uabimicrobium amorphum]
MTSLLQKALLCIFTIYLVIIATVGIFSIYILLILIVFPIGFVFDIYMKRKHKKFMEEYNVFLETIEDQEFFCYTPKKSSLAFIEKQILPHLSSGVAPLFWQGKHSRNRWPHKFLSNMLREEGKKYPTSEQGKRYPLILKVKKGRVFGYSLHQELYKEALAKQNHELFLKIIEEKLEEWRKAKVYRRKVRGGRIKAR